jgi:hypothetical protein
MGICLLKGHEFDTLPGVGQYAGQMFDICRHCGKTVPLGPGHTTTTYSYLEDGEVKRSDDPPGAGEI